MIRLVLILLLLAGCATPQERAHRAIVRHGPYCETLGFLPNTDAWRQCIQRRVTDSLMP